MPLILSICGWSVSAGGELGEHDTCFTFDIASFRTRTELDHIPLDERNMFGAMVLQMTI